MIEITSNCKHLKSDIEYVEELVQLLYSMGVDEGMFHDYVQYLLQISGSKEFLQVFSPVWTYFLSIKNCRNGVFGLGYVIPWVNVYGCIPYIGHGTKLGQIAGQLLVNQGHGNYVSNYHLTACVVNPCSYEITEKINSVIGNDMYPCTIDCESLNRNAPQKRRVEERIFKSHKKQRVDEYHANNLVEFDVDLNGVDAVKLPHCAPAAGPIIM